MEAYIESSDAENGVRPEPRGPPWRFLRRAVDLIVRLMIPLVAVALAMGVARVFLDLGAVWESASIAAGFDILITDLLSMFVVIELLKSITEYVDAQRIRITFIVDAALVFVLREVMIGLFRRDLGAGQLAALSALLLVVGGIRAASVLYSPGRGSHASDG